jgi:hypothetical protein
MKTVKITHSFPQSADEVWAIFADVTRCDWVPAVEKITLDGDVRSFEMEGIGEVQERIVSLDHEARRLQYSAIKARSVLEHHLATIQISEAEDGGCHFSWQTEIAPDAFEPAIQQGMDAAFAQLKRLLA